VESETAQAFLLFKDSRANKLVFSLDEALQFESLDKADPYGVLNRFDSLIDCPVACLRWRPLRIQLQRRGSSWIVVSAAEIDPSEHPWQLNDAKFLRSSMTRDSFELSMFVGPSSECSVNVPRAFLSPSFARSIEGDRQIRPDTLLRCLHCHDSNRVVVLGAPFFFGRVVRRDESGECGIEIMRERTDRILFENVFPSNFSITSYSLSLGDKVHFHVFQKYKRKWLPDFYTCALAE
jgi:hypothetical protein